MSEADPWKSSLAKGWWPFAKAHPIPAFALLLLIWFLVAAIWAPNLLDHVFAALARLPDSGPAIAIIIMASAFFAVAMNLKREALYFRTELETHKTDTKKKLAEQEQKFEDKLADQKAELDECRKQCENDRVSNVSLKETIEGLSELVTAMSRRKKKGPPIRGGTRKTDPPLPSGAPPAVLPRRGHKRKRRSTH